MGYPSRDGRQLSNGKNNNVTISKYDTIPLPSSATRQVHLPGGH